MFVATYRRRGVVLAALTVCLLSTLSAGAQDPPMPTAATQPGQDSAVVTDRAEGPPASPPPPADFSRVPAQPALGQSTLPTPSADFSVRLARAPKMLGDFLGQTCGRSVAYDLMQPGLPSVGTQAVIDTFATCDVAGRVRIQDNNSALPTDRVYFDYSYFHNAQLTNGGIGVNRFAPGVEKTFGDGLGSVELRVPMAITLNSTQTVGTQAAVDQYEFGNLNLILKLALWQDCESVLAAGMGIGLPTANDLTTRDGLGPVVRVENESVHLIPYLAYGYAPAGGSDFIHAFLTFDFDPNGNTVLADQGAGLAELGGLSDQHLVSLSVAYGNWFYEAPRCTTGVDALGWSTELHYTATLNDGDSLQAGQFTLGDPNADLSVLNLTVGGHLRYGQTFLTLGYAVPVTDDKVFDGELRFMANRFF